MSTHGAHIHGKSSHRAELASTHLQPNQEQPSDSLASLEQDILTVLNQTRESPQSLLTTLKAFGNSTHRGVYTCPQSHLRFNLHEGDGAVGQCEEFLQGCKAVGRVQRLVPLDTLARQHAADLGRSGLDGHTSSLGVGLKDRLEKVGKWDGAIAENVSLAEGTGKMVVLGFVMDDGNKERTRRKNVFYEE